MGSCIVTFDAIEILDHKSDSEHADNLWLCLAWTVNARAFSTSMPLRATHGDTAIWSGDTIAEVSERIDCGDDDTVVLVYLVVNLSAGDLDAQARAASDVAGQTAQSIAQLYLDIAQKLLPVAGDFVPGLPLIGKLIGKGAAAVIAHFEERLVALIGTLFDEVIGPSVEVIAREVEIVLSGRPNCNGHLLVDFFDFPPGLPHEPIAINQLHQGSPMSRCGPPSRARVRARFERWGEPTIIPPDWERPSDDAPESAVRSFHHKARLIGQRRFEGFVGAFPNFHTAIRDRDQVDGSVLIRHEAGEFRDIRLEDLWLEQSALGDFAERMRVTQAYATRQGFVGGFPTFFHAEQRIFERTDGQPTDIVVCGTVLLREGFAEWRDIPVDELGDAALDNIPARFRAVSDYAARHGFVGGFPNFFHARTLVFDDTVGDITGPRHGSGGRATIVCGTVLLRENAAEWRDVVRVPGPG